VISYASGDESAQQTLDNLEKYEGTAEAIRSDAVVSADVNVLFESVMARHGRLDVVVRVPGAVLKIYIKTTPERLWEAITSPEIRKKYNFGAAITSDWTPGSRFQMGHPEAGLMLGEGENLEVDPPRRLVQSMTALWSDEVRSEGETRVTWEIEPVGDSCRLTVIHDQLREDANDQLYGGWPMILSGLKTWLETGELLTTPGSLMYDN
jgi:uncharacterized protein YndB with AHSA1/START domain